MTIRFFCSAFSALFFLAGAGLTLEAQNTLPPKASRPASPEAQANPGANKENKVASTPKAKALPGDALPRPRGKLKPVDINSATKEEISFMLKIDVATAAKIVAGRPYLSKAKLVTKNILPKETYFAIKDRIVAKQGTLPK